MGKLQAFIISAFLLGSVFSANADLNEQNQEAKQVLELQYEISGIPEGEGSSIAAFHAILKQSENGNPFAMSILAESFLGEYKSPFGAGFPEDFRYSAMWITLSYNKLHLFFAETGQRGCMYPVQPSCSYGKTIGGDLRYIYRLKDELWKRLEDTLFQTKYYFDVQSWTRRCFLNNYKDCNYI